MLLPKEAHPFLLFHKETISELMAYEKQGLIFLQLNSVGDWFSNSMTANSFGVLGCIDRKKKKKKEKDKTSGLIRSHNKKAKDYCNTLRN